MTTAEWTAACRLSECSFLPGSFDKRFVRQLRSKKDKEMTDKGRKFMLTLLTKYKRQLPHHEELSNAIRREAYPNEPRPVPLPRLPGMQESLW